MEEAKELYFNLLPWEKAEFCDWLLTTGELKDILKDILNDKYEEWRCETIKNIIQNI